MLKMVKRVLQQESAVCVVLSADWKVSHLFQVGRTLKCYSQFFLLLFCFVLWLQQYHILSLLSNQIRNVIVGI